MENTKISGGFILLARKILESELMDKPPHYLKLWVWMLMQANWKDRGKLKRGQLFTSIREMQSAGAYKVGYRLRTLTKAEVRSVYEAFTKSTMISTTKSTRGMIITIENYDLYQSVENYEQHNGQHNEHSTNNTVATHYMEEGERKEEGKKEIKSKPKTPPRPPKGGDIVLPDWVPKEEWDAFVLMRKKTGFPLTDDGVKLAIKKLDKLREDGDPAEILNQSTMQNWRGLFPVREETIPRNGMPILKGQAITARNKQVAENVLRRFESGGSTAQDRGDSNGGRGIQGGFERSEIGGVPRSDIIVVNPKT